jgi:IclR family acetate operon transcriptional repressor
LTLDISANSTEPSRKRGRPARAEEGAAVGSLSRGLQILDALVQAPGWLSLSDISAETGLDASTAYRLLQTLVETGYAVRDEGLKRYLPGPRALSPVSLFHPLTQVRREALPVLEFLQTQIGETCAFVLFLGHERVVVDFVRGNHPLSPYYDTWLKSPLHGSASGKLLLAWMPEAERDELLGPGPYPAHTARTITSPADFSVELEKIRTQGHAVAREDAYQSLVALGVPLAFQRDAQPVGCLVLTAPSASIPAEAEARVTEQLRAAATLLMNGAPTMQVFRQWAVRSGRRAGTPSIA